MQALVITWTTWLANMALLGYEKVSTVCSDVWRLYKEDHLWFISDSGMFADSSFLTISDKSSFWVFDGKTIVNKEANSVRKHLPFLSAEMCSGSSVVSMDTFLEEVRWQGEGEIPFSVLMAAFMIHSKTFYNWKTAKFKVFMRNGDEKEFVGNPDTSN